MFNDRIKDITKNSDENVIWLTDKINEYVQLKEYEILAICDYNLNVPTGTEIFESILKMSNPEYDFSDTVKVIDRLTQMCIFYQDQDSN